MSESSSLRWAGDVPSSLLSTIHAGVLRTAYRGLAFLKSPFDLVLYLQLFERLKPRTIIEIGTYEGGSALWFADTLTAMGVHARIVSVDLNPPKLDDPRITLVPGDALALGSALQHELLETLAHPMVVIDDSAHLFESTRAVLTFFHPYLRPDDYIVVEDGIVSQFSEPGFLYFEDGPNRAVSAFLNQYEQDYEVDRTLCDFYGTNVTYNPNAWVRRK